jgi:hypothetical protein
VIVSVTHAAGVHVTHAIQVVDHLTVAHLIAAHKVAADHAAHLAAVLKAVADHAAQPHLAHLVAQLTHLAAHQLNANLAHLGAQLSAQLVAHKVLDSPQVEMNSVSEGVPSELNHKRRYKTRWLGIPK